MEHRKLHDCYNIPLMGGREEGESHIGEKLKKCPAVCYTVNNISKYFHNHAGLNKGYCMSEAIVDKLKYVELKNLVSLSTKIVNYIFLTT